MREFVDMEIYNVEVSRDLHLYHCGAERCLPEHSYGPAVRDHYLIHFVLEGEGYFEVDGISYNVKKGQAFLIVPDAITIYKTTGSNPWHYIWLGFNGLKALSHLETIGLTRNSPIFPSENTSCEEAAYNSIKNCINDIINISSCKERSRDIKLQSLLYEFLAVLAEHSKNVTPVKGAGSIQQWYVDRAVTFIATNYSRKISIGELTRHAGIDRSYMYELFVERFKLSPQDFLINFRMHKACELLLQTNLPVGAVSHSVGYEDQLAFSRMFRKVIGKSPLKYRQGET